MERIALPETAPLPSDALLTGRGDARPDRRRHRRLALALDARVVLPGGGETAGRIACASAGGAEIVAPVAPGLGEAVVVYADRLGRLEGKVLRATREGFVLTFSKRASRAKRLADTLTWIANMGPERDRRAARRYQKDEAATLIRESGDAVACRILDISTTGASVSIGAHARPAIGEVVTVGLMKGRVVRHHESGVGMAFATAADADAGASRAGTGAAAPSRTEG